MNKKYTRTFVVLIIAALLLFAVTTVVFASPTGEEASNAPAIITLVILNLYIHLPSFITELWMGKATISIMCRQIAMLYLVE